MTLAEAREKARAFRLQIDSGADPVAKRLAAISAAAAERSTLKTFAKTAEAYIEQHEKSWKNAKHAAQWTATLKAYANPVLGDPGCRLAGIRGQRYSDDGCCVHRHRSHGQRRRRVPTCRLRHQSRCLAAAANNRAC